MTDTLAPAANAAPVNELLGRLVAVLQREQAAIRTLDLPALGEAVRDKEALAGELASAHADLKRLSTSVEPALRDARQLAIHVRALAHANRILLDEVTAVVGARVGVSTETTGYDARGGRRGYARHMRSGVL